ncbi:MAG TPA: SDR family NAD(P)-dependent oxidoreductase, partial [Pseudomonas sp.]|nr:SDR family NAD(P)-dependent oxidoreductase [Pseudomonas sp.]
MQIANSNFIVSGAASGLGAATAQMLVEAGARVMLVDLNAQAVEAKARELGDNARFAVADISDEQAAKAAVDAAVAAFGSLHGLVNCAGIVGAEKVLG